MKKAIYIFLFLIIGLNHCFAQESQAQDKTKIKTGWNLGALPTITFNTDLGLQYGALVNLFYYGDGETYPEAKQSLYAEVSRYTKGSGINRLYWDTKMLIPNVRMIADISYVTDKTFDLYGYNGYQSVLNEGWQDEDSDDYISRMFYKYDRRLLRIGADFRWKMGHPNIDYFAGLSFNNYQVSRIDFNNLNKGKSDSDKLKDTVTLYDEYVNWGIIGEDEKNGGNVTYIKIGASYDTRDHEASPTKGIWTEMIFNLAPSFLGMKNFGHSIFAISHRQYIPFFKGRLVGLYRLAYQQKLSGEIPFFMAQNLNYTWLKRVTNEGLGGATTMRGIRRNRVQGDGMAYGNVEFRFRAVDFRFINQNWYISLNAFCDFGMVTDKRDLHVNNPDILNNSQFFSNKKESLHGSYGLGLGIVMNRNFIIALDYGRAMNPQDGSGGFYMGINFVL